MVSEHFLFSVFVNVPRCALFTDAADQDILAEEPYVLPARKGLNKLMPKHHILYVTSVQEPSFASHKPAEPYLCKWLA